MRRGQSRVAVNQGERVENAQHGFRGALQQRHVGNDPLAGSLLGCPTAAVCPPWMATNPLRLVAARKKKKSG